MRRNALENSVTTGKVIRRIDIPREMMFACLRLAWGIPIKFIQNSNYQKLRDMNFHVCKDIDVLKTVSKKLTSISYISPSGHSNEPQLLLVTFLAKLIRSVGCYLLSEWVNNFYTVKTLPEAICFANSLPAHGLNMLPRHASIVN